MNTTPGQLRLWYLPSGAPQTASLHDGCIERLAGCPAELVQGVAATLDRAAPPLSRLPVEQIIAAIDAVIDAWQEATNPCRAALLDYGPALTGYSRATLQYALDVMLPRFAAPGLRALIAAEIGDPAALDRFVRHDSQPDGHALRHARGPGRQFHVFAGSVPTVPIFSLICALLLKSPVLAKPSSHDLLFPALFAQTLAAVEPALNAAIAVLPWSGGTPELDAAAMHGAGAVVAYGSDETIAALRAVAPPSAGFTGYGHRISIAAVTREAVTSSSVSEIARQLAWDVGLFDQHGCLSPQLALVETGGEVEPRQLAASTAAALSTLQHALPRGALSPAEAAVIQSSRDLARFQASLSDGIQLWQSEGSTDWTVLYRATAEGLHGGRNRVLPIVPVSCLAADLPRLCGGWPLSTIGLAASDHRMKGLTETFAPFTTRICRLGTMGEPPVTWRHDGRPNLAGLITWVDLER